MKSLTREFRSMKTLILLAGAATLAGCTSIGYRCPLDATEKPEYPTACSSMHDAMAGAKRGTGSKTSVLMDEKGRLIPPELLKAQGNSAPVFAGHEPYRQKSGDPVFVPPKKYEVWTRAAVDANGNLHDGHHAWFTTPGRWAYGTVDKPGAVGQNILSPARPEALPGRIVTQAEANARDAQRAPQPNAGNIRSTPAGNTAQERDQAALQNLSAAANSFSNPSNAQPKPAPAKKAAAPGVTAPELGLLD